MRPLSGRTALIAALSGLLALAVVALVVLERLVGPGGGMPSIGGPFQLIDQDGRAVTEATYRGKIDVPGGPAPGVLLAALREAEELYAQLDKPSIYASLVHAAKTDDPRHGALLARTCASAQRSLTIRSTSTSTSPPESLCPCSRALITRVSFTTRR